MNPANPPDPLTTLTTPGVPLHQVLRALEALEAQADRWRPLTLGVSSNVTVDLLAVHLRKEALLHGRRLDVHQGNFDDPLGDVERFKAAGVDQMLLLQFFDNLLPAFEAQIQHLPSERLAQKEEEFRMRMRHFLQGALGMRRVFIPTFHRFTPSEGGRPDRVDRALECFNRALLEEIQAFPAVVILDSREMLEGVGRSQAFDVRFYLKAKAPYAMPFLSHLAHRMAARSRGFDSGYYKALVLDCDNTLWGGVVGEDGLEGIHLDPHDAPGNLFWRVQNELLGLEQRGVLLCLCSKNNSEDVHAVLDHHPHAVLRREHFAASQVNWTDKVQNLKALAEKLNIGLESMVFLDDSPVECEAVRMQLPVRTFQVPPRASDYLRVIDEIKSLFPTAAESLEATSKTGQYRLIEQAESLRAASESHESYLASLQVVVSTTRDVRGHAARASELSMKSNQFNLTTRRYTESEIRSAMEDPGWTVYTISVAHRFGDSGITGVLIMHWDGDQARVDSFLLSCRVLGLGVERVIWPRIREEALRRGCHFLVGEYLPTPKNAQTAPFYENLGLTPLDPGPDGAQCFKIELCAFSPQPPPWIEVLHDE